jgi:Lar family restriction alleviation protein
MNTDTDKLLPCPFCGGEGELYEPNEEVAVIACLQCNAEGGYYGGEDSSTPDDAIRLWNTRAPVHAPENDGEG